MAFGFFKKKETAPLKCQIEFCVSNMAQGSSDAYDELQNRTDIEVEEYGCTSNYELCVEHLFAIVDGEVVIAQDSKSLLTSIEEEINNSRIT